MTTHQSFSFAVPRSSTCSRRCIFGQLVREENSTELSARVAAQLVALDGVSTYAIEFVEQDERAETFWGIIFPPNTSNA
jgi:hypothetical protein